MKKSRTLPALLSLVLALAMMLSLSVTAFAASPARASGNGYSMTTMKVNGKYYDIAASTGETNKSAYTAALQSSVFGTLLLVRGSIRHTTGMFRSQLAQVILRPQQTTHTLDLIL